MDNEEVFDFLNGLSSSASVVVFIYSHVLKIPPHVIAEKRNISLPHCLNLIKQTEQEFKDFPEKRHEEAISAIQAMIQLCRKNNYY